MQCKAKRPKLNGKVTIRRLQLPQLETTAKIAKGELCEPLQDVAERVDIIFCDERDDALCIVDDQGLSIMSKLVDAGLYYITGGTVTSVCADATVHSVNPSTAPAQRFPPDAAVLWAFDKRVLLHSPDTHRSPETPYRLERAIEMLQACPRAAELLPSKMLAPLSGNEGDAARVVTAPENFSSRTCRAVFIPPRLATSEEVLAFQDRRVYTEFLKVGTALPNLRSDVYCNDKTSSVAARLSAAAVIDAGDAVLRDLEFVRQEEEFRLGKPATAHRKDPTLLAFCLVRPPGHHCTASRPSGFCLVNNVAIASQQLLQRKYLLDTDNARMRAPRIAIIDLDVHYGEGTSSFVDSYKAPQDTASFPLLYLSLHRFDEGSFYPFESSGSSTYVGNEHPGCVCNVGVHTNAHHPHRCAEVISDFLFTSVVEKVFIPRLKCFAPDMVFVSLGFDAAYGDPLGKMAVEGGFAATMKTLKQWCFYGTTSQSAASSQAPIPGHYPVGLVTVLEGGYNPEAVAQGILSVGYALTFPRIDSDVLEYAESRVPRVWGDLRRKQERRHREWMLAQREREEGEKTSQVASSDGGEEEEPPLVEEDMVLIQKHTAWCDQCVAKVIALQREAINRCH